MSHCWGHTEPPDRSLLHLVPIGLPSTPNAPTGIPPITPGIHTCPVPLYPDATRGHSAPVSTRTFYFHGTDVPGHRIHLPPSPAWSGSQTTCAGCRPDLRRPSYCPGHCRPPQILSSTRYLPFCRPLTLLGYKILLKRLLCLHAQGEPPPEAAGSCPSSDPSIPPSLAMDPGCWASRPSSSSLLAPPSQHGSNQGARLHLADGRNHSPYLTARSGIGTRSFLPLPLSGRAAASPIDPLPLCLLD